MSRWARKKILSKHSVQCVYVYAYTHIHPPGVYAVFGEKRVYMRFGVYAVCGDFLGVYIRGSRLKYVILCVQKYLK